MIHRPRPTRVLTLLAAFTLATLLATAIHFATPAGPIAAQLAGDGDETCEMSISKTNNTGGETEEDETFTWSIEVDSDDDCNNEAYEVTDNVPSDFTILSVSSGCTRSGNQVECDGELDASESDEFEIRVRAEDDCGNRTNTATLDPESSTTGGDHSDSDTVRIDCAEATIKIVKDTNPEDSSETFGFDIDQVSGGSFEQSFTLGDDDSRTFTVDAGSYIVSEDSESGWTLIDIDCTGSASISDESHSDNDVRITVSDGESATCTFTNDRDRDEPTRTPTRTPSAVATPVIIFIPAPPQPVVQPAPPPPPVAQVQEVRAPAPQPTVRVALPRTGDGPLESDGAALPVGLGLLVIAGIGLTYWRLSRVRQ
jgi:hypothetical protein